MPVTNLQISMNEYQRLIDEDIEKALDLVDQEVLVNLLGVDPVVCSQFRTIWKKMQRRRLGRG